MHLNFDILSNQDSAFKSYGSTIATRNDQDRVCTLPDSEISIIRKKAEKIIFELMEQNSQLRKNQYQLIQQIALLKIKLQSKQKQIKDTYQSYQNVINKLEADYRENNSSKLNLCTQETKLQKHVKTQNIKSIAKVCNNSLSKSKLSNKIGKPQTFENQISWISQNPEKTLEEQSSFISKISSQFQSFAKSKRSYKHIHDLAIESEQIIQKKQQKIQQNLQKSISSNKSFHRNPKRNFSAENNTRSQSSKNSRQINEKIQKIISNFKLYKYKQIPQ